MATDESGGVPDPVVQARGLVKSYGEVPAVAGIDLEVHRGEVFALLGPNGAGKTTTVEILEGYRHRDAGDAAVLGRDPGRPTRSWRARIGIVAQTSSENPELTVEEMVRHFAGYYPRPRDPDQVIAAVGLDDKRKARTRSLSGGQRRRLDVALGIVGDPELLFLDEPTTGFDPQARRAFWDLIRDLHAQGTTILLTTHYLDEAEQLAHRVGVIVRGRLVALDTPQELGGRQERQAVVSWLDGEERRTRATTTPTQVVAELASRYDGEVPGLQVLRPTLEDVYLGLIREHAGEDSGEAVSTSGPADVERIRS